MQYGRLKDQSTASPAHQPLAPMSIIAITLSISVIVFILLSLAIIFCLRFRQRHLIDVYRRRGSNTRLARYPGGHVRIPDQAHRDGQQAVFEKTNSLSSHATTKLPGFSRVGGPPSWNGSLELHHHPQLEHGSSYYDSVMMATTSGGEIEVIEGQPSKALTLSRQLKRGASFPVAQSNKADPISMPNVKGPVLRSESTPLFRTATAKKPYGPRPPPDESKKDSPDTDQTSITEWPSAALEPMPNVPKKPSKAKGMYGRRRSKSSANYQSLASVINLAMRGPTKEGNGSGGDGNERGLQRQLSTLSSQSRSPGTAPESPVPPVPAKFSDRDNCTGHHDIFSMKRRDSLNEKTSPLPHCLDSFSSLQTTCSSILEAVKYTNNGAQSHTFPSSPPNFSSSPLSSRTSGPSASDDFGTPPVMGLTSPSVARLHRKQLSYEATQSSGGRGNHGLRQSISYGGRMLREGSLTSLATLGRPWKEGEKEGEAFHFSSPPPDGVLPPSSPSFNCTNGTPHSITPTFANGTPHSTIPTSPITPPCEPNGPLNQSCPHHFTLTSHTNRPEFPPSHPWARAATPTESSSDRRNHLYWDLRPFPKGPCRPHPTKKGHRRQNCIHINYDPTEPSSPQPRTLLSPIASVSDHPPAWTPRPPSSSTFSTTPVEDHAAGTKRKIDSEITTNRLEPSQSEADLRDSPTFAMVNYYSLTPSPTQNHSSPLHHPFWRTSITPSDKNSNTAENEDIFLTPSATSHRSITPPQLKSIKEPSPPPTHKSYIPFSPIATSQEQQSQQPAQPQTQTRHLHFSVLSLRRMNSDISTTTTATSPEMVGERGYLNLGGSAVTAVGVANTTSAAGVVSGGLVISPNGTTSDTVTHPSNTCPISQGRSFLEEPPRKITRVCSTTAAAAVGRRQRRAIGERERKGEKEEKGEARVLVGLGVGIDGGFAG
jgi:hypothetical protein